MTNAFRMTIGAEAGEVARVNSAFGEFADAHQLPATVRRSLHVALDELLKNTIDYGFAGRPDGEVCVAVELAADRVTVTLTDDGGPFDPFEGISPDTTLAVEARRIGGLGIHLVRKMMDEVSYQRRDDRNVVVLAKRLMGGARAGHSGGRSMEITTDTENSVTVVGLSGNLDSNTAPQAQQALEGVLAHGAKKVAIDFTALDYISSAGLRVLLGAAKKLTGAGGGLRLFGLNETVREVFEISGFATILAVYTTRAEALRGF
jgi:serine/threonine-protein kinase RsbW